MGYKFCVAATIDQYLQAPGSIIVFMRVFQVYFCTFTFTDKYELISEGIDDSDRSASENEVLVIKEAAEDQGGQKQ